MKTRNKLSGGRAFAVAAALVLALAPVLAEARASKGTSSGNRGARTQSAPAPTATAPTPGQSFQRSAGPNQAAPATGLNRPAAAGAAAPAAAAGGGGGPAAAVGRSGRPDSGGSRLSEGVARLLRDPGRRAAWTLCRGGAAAWEAAPDSHQIVLIPCQLID